MLGTFATALQIPEIKDRAMTEICSTIRETAPLDIMQSQMRASFWMTHPYPGSCVPIASAFQMRCANNRVDNLLIAYIFDILILFDSQVLRLP